MVIYFRYTGTVVKVNIKDGKWKIKFDHNSKDKSSIPKINHHRNGKGLLNYDYIFVTWQMGKVFKQD
jgi:hypothetical protein